MSAINLKVEPKEKSQVEITGEISAEELNLERPSALKRLNQDVKVDGFRPGHIPEKILVEKVGEQAVLMEMAEEALRKVYPEIIIQEKIEAIGRPEVTITKLAPGNNMGFKLVTAIMPKVELGDYETAAKKVRDQKAEPIEVTPEEIQKVIDEVQKSRTKEGEPAPEINDAFAKSLGEFETVEILKEKISDNIKHEKEHRARDKRRTEILEAVAKTTEIVIPDVLIDYELDKMFSELKAEIEQMGLTLEKYLEHIKKTETDLRTAWRVDAEKRVKTGLILTAVAAKEKISAEADLIKKETDHLLEHHPDAERSRAETYIGDLLRNEAVVSFLETGEKKS